MNYCSNPTDLKITDMQAAIGLSQLRKLPVFLEKRTQNANYLMKKLEDLKQDLIDGRLRKFYVFYGEDYGIRKHYINKIENLQIII